MVRAFYSIYNVTTYAAHHSNNSRISNRYMRYIEFEMRIVYTHPRHGIPIYNSYERA